MPMIDSAIHVLRIALLAIGAVFLLIAVIDWTVRTRRINPFSPVARFFRRVIDPMLAPIEARLVRVGGLPTQAPWWGLAAVLVIGVLMIVLLQWIRSIALTFSFAATQGPMGIAALLVQGLFELLKFALVVRVIVSWVGMRYSWWARTAYSLTDWLVKPIARMLPSFGMIDLSPLVAYFVLYILEGIVMRVVFR
ncbi:MAG: YggT family protein [Gemmatimonadota bacterium]